MLEDDVLFAERRYGPADDRVGYGRLLRMAAGASTADWVMGEQPERDAIHVRGLLMLIWATGCRLFTYFDMPQFSRERAEVLLTGAGKLGIETDWKGWA